MWWWIIGAFVAWILKYWFSELSKEEQEEYTKKFYKLIIDNALNILKWLFEQFYEHHQKNKK